LPVDRIIVEKPENRFHIGRGYAAPRLAPHALDVLRPIRVIRNAAFERPSQRVALRAPLCKNLVVGAHVRRQCRHVETVGDAVILVTRIKHDRESEGQ
jgi:hypothetical protein